jgi:hypothetical protein
MLICILCCCLTRVTRFMTARLLVADSDSGGYKAGDGDGVSGASGPQLISYLSLQEAQRNTWERIRRGDRVSPLFAVTAGIAADLRCCRPVAPP